VVYQTTFQGATFTVTPTAANAFTFGITGANALSGDWAGAAYLGAFAFETASIGGGSNLTATLINPATGQVAQTVPGGLDANGCNGNGGFTCFNWSPNVAVAPSLLFNIVSTGGTFVYGANGPDLKIDWSLSSSTDTHVGSLFSDVIPAVTIPPPPPPIPEPGTWAMMIVGFGLVGAGLRMRSRARVSALA
jgi:hypothetical protein